MFNIITNKFMQVVFCIVCIIGIGFGVRACTLKCPTVTGKREDPGFFGSYYLDLSDRTTKTVSGKIYSLNDIGEHHC